MSDDEKRQGQTDPRDLARQYQERILRDKNEIYDAYLAGYHCGYERAKWLMWAKENIVASPNVIMTHHTYVCDK